MSDGEIQGNLGELMRLAVRWYRLRLQRELSLWQAGLAATALAVWLGSDAQLLAALAAGMACGLFAAEMMARCVGRGK